MTPHNRPLRVGEQFNPRFEACGFFPDEIVGRRRDLTDGQKWLYSRMVRWARLEDGNRPNERAGEVWRAHSTIAEELGKSEKQVSRDLAKLESEGFLAHRQRDGRKSNTYLFLFHQEFERTPMSGQIDPATEFERTPTSVQTAPSEEPGSNLNGHPRPVTAHLNGHPRPPNPKEFNHKGKSSSSSTEQNGRLEDPAKPDGSPTTATTIPFPLKANLRPTPREWSAEEILDVRRAMQNHFSAPMLPDFDLMRDVLVWMQGPDDVRFWLLDLAARRVKPRGWGFYRTDAETWPRRRSDVHQQVDENLRVIDASAQETKEAMKAADVENEAAMALYEQQKRDRAEFSESATSKGWKCVHQASECGRCFGYGRRDIHTGEFCDCKSGRKLIEDLERCARCKNEGIVRDKDDRTLFAWCNCVHAARKREGEPSAVDDGNEAVKALRASAAEPARASGAGRMRPAQSFAGVLAAGGERRVNR